MAKEHKPGFIYMKSEILKQEIAMSIKTGWVYCEDGVRYSPQEVNLVASKGAEFDLACHRVKKVIGGEVVDVKRLEGNSEAKQVEGSAGNNTHNNTDTSQKVSGAHGACAQDADGELDIF